MVNQLKKLAKEKRFTMTEFLKPEMIKLANSGNQIKPKQKSVKVEPEPEIEEVSKHEMIDIELDSDIFKGVGRNAPCPCGSGKKFNFVMESNL